MPMVAVPFTNITLASASPRRRELLRLLVERFALLAADTEEILIPGIPVTENAVRIALEKARWVAGRAEAGWILAADTVIDCDGEIVGKPQSAADAVRILLRLVNRRHDVVTGIALLDSRSGQEWTSVVSSAVYMRQADESEIARYVSTGEPMDKAGAYAIQGAGAALVSRFEGCFTNIVGLPVCETARLLAGAQKGTGCFSQKGTGSFSSSFSRRKGTGWFSCRTPDGKPCPRIAMLTGSETAEGGR